MNKKNQAIKHLEKAIFYLKKIGNKFEIARAYNSLGTIFTYINKLEDAIECYKKQLNIADLIGDIRLIGYGLGNIGYCYAKLNQIAEAEEYIEKAKKIFKKTKNENILFTIYKTNGVIFHYHKKWDKAIDNLNKCFSEPARVIGFLNLFLHKMVCHH